MDEYNKLNYRDIHETFSRSIFGKKLRESPRFHIFKPDDVNTRHWVEILGDDVNNLNHMIVTLGIAEGFVGSLNGAISLEDKRIICLTAIIHDWAEAVMGDIPLPQKTDEDEKREITVLKELFEIFLTTNKYGHKVPTEQLDRVCDILSGDDELSLVFKTIEEMGYMKTGLRAWVKKDDFEGQELEESLFNLSIDVINRHLVPLIERSRLYPPVMDFLLENADTISDIIASTPRDIQHAWYVFLVSLDAYLQKSVVAD